MRTGSLVSPARAPEQASSIVASAHIARATPRGFMIPAMPLNVASRRRRCLIQINRADGKALPMNVTAFGTANLSQMSTVDIADVSSARRDETVSVALLLAFAGGYLDAYTWIIHGVMANAQT